MSPAADSVYLPVSRKLSVYHRVSSNWARISTIFDRSVTPVCCEFIAYVTKHESESYVFWGTLEGECIALVVAESHIWNLNFTTFLIDMDGCGDLYSWRTSTSVNSPLNATNRQSELGNVYILNSRAMGKHCTAGLPEESNSSSQVYCRTSAIRHFCSAIVCHRNDSLRVGIRTLTVFPKKRAL